MGEATRVCRKCGKEKPLKMYHREHKAGSAVGWRNACKTCINKQQLHRLHLKKAGQWESRPNRDDPETGKRQCTKCGEWKAYSEFSPSGMGDGKVRSHCRKCNASSVQQRYFNRKNKGICCHCGSPSNGKHLCDSCNLDRRDLWARKKRGKKAAAIAYLGGECVGCGYKTVFVSVYDFHHPDPSVKEKEISNIIARVPWEMLVKELDKCVLLCSNCHRIEHEIMRSESEQEEP